MFVPSLQNWSVKTLVGMLIAGTVLSAGIMPARAASTGELELLYKQ